TYVPTLVPIKKINTTANSDHASFWTRGYKAFMNIEDNNDFTPFYHTVNDKFSTLNVPFFRNSVRVAIAALTAFSNNMKMDFYHTPLQSGNFTTPRTATVVIKSKAKIGMTGTAAPRLYYKINNGSYTSVNYNYYNLDTFKFTIPGTVLGNTVSYYVAAQDSAQNFVCTYPAGGRGLNPPGSQAPLQPFTYTIESVNYACVGTGTTAVGYPFYSFYMDSRTDMLYTQSELGVSGPATITKIGFNFATIASQMLNGFYIKFQNTNATSLSGFTSTGWMNVYSGTYVPPGTGWQYITLTTPFYYDGANNLLVEVCFNNSSYTSNSTVFGTPASGMTYHQHSDLSSGDGCQIATGSLQATRPNVCFVYQTGTGTGNTAGTLPSKFDLSQNYPNPFNPVTKINYAVPVKGFVTIKIYNILGKEVASLVSDTKEPGYYSVDFNASTLSSGVYYYKLESGTFSDVKKMMLIK
ncbi:MAG: T9SS type A sorting domain-containing protein, partial [Ignavibacteria bacterium]|nr:T9SS type A sorting domain-containing protein [Ignavibacteria bacterium]